MEFGLITQEYKELHGSEPVLQKYCNEYLLGLSGKLIRFSLIHVDLRSSNSKKKSSSQKSV